MKIQFNQTLHAVLSATVISSSTFQVVGATRIAAILATQVKAGEVMQDR